MRNFITKYERELRELDSQTPITVVHGTQDTVVPIKGSEELVQKINAQRSPEQAAQYIVVDDLHPLNRYFTSKVAKQLVQTLLESDPTRSAVEN